MEIYNHKLCFQTTKDVASEVNQLKQKEYYLKNDACSFQNFCDFITATFSNQWFDKHGSNVTKQCKKLKNTFNLIPTKIAHDNFKIAFAKANPAQQKKLGWRLQEFKKLHGNWLDISLGNVYCEINDTNVSQLTTAIIDIITDRLE